MTVEDTDLEETWKTDLSDRMEEINDRKRSSITGRQVSLAAYIRILTSKFAEAYLQGKEIELVGSLCKSIKSETSEKETVLALKALAITLITSPSEAIHEATSSLLRRTISDSQSVAIKTAAIHTLGTVTFFGGASDDEILDIMSFLLEIVSSDGAFIGAQDECDPVAAAMEDWGFLATLIDDLSVESDEAIEAFLEQLDSSDPDVQIAAGECIALLYEKSYTPPEAGETFSGSESDEGEGEDTEEPKQNGRPKLIKRYSAYNRPDQVVHTLSGLASLSAKHLSKKDRKELHTNFADILNSVQHPSHGPRYQTAIDAGSGKQYGSRMSVRIRGEGVMKIDKWWKMMRLKGLRRVLQGGFVTHYESNPVVFESLPIMIEADKAYKRERK
ncbi:hypothetical protein MMC25_001354 [Agyrium rufum]|nr:hypothetical protein [Agyrium rufum]